MADTKQGQPNQTDRENQRVVNEPDNQPERKATPREDEERLQEETEGTSDQADGSSTTETKVDR